MANFTPEFELELLAEIRAAINRIRYNKIFKHYNKQGHANQKGYEKEDEDIIRDIINGILYDDEVNWKLIGKIANIYDMSLYSPWEGFTGDFWHSPMHLVIDTDDIDLVKGIIKHGKGVLGDTDRYRNHKCKWYYKEYIIANMKLEMMKALDINPTREEMIKARQCVFQEAPDKKYTAFMDKVMDTEYSNIMTELNRLVPGPVNKRNLNYNKTLKNINNLLYPPKKTNTKKKNLLYPPTKNNTKKNDRMTDFKIPNTRNGIIKMLVELEGRRAKWQEEQNDKKEADKLFH